MELYLKPEIMNFSVSSSSSISFQGWSGAASNQFVERKVVLTDSSSGCDHSTKLKRRLNRFGDDGLSANLGTYKNSYMYGLKPLHVFFNYMQCNNG